MPWPVTERSTAGPHRPRGGTDARTVTATVGTPSTVSRRAETSSANRSAIASLICVRVRVAPSSGVRSMFAPYRAPSVGRRSEGVAHVHHQPDLDQAEHEWHEHHADEHEVDDRRPVLVARSGLSP